MAGWISKLIKKNKSMAVPAQAQNAAEPVLSAKDARVKPNGEAIIPEGTAEIGFGAFQRNKQLRCVKLPSSVKKINSRAFAECENLERVLLNEGLEVIEGNVFSGCSSLKTLIFPDSLKEVHAYAFYCTSLTEPVYNRSGDILHHYPSGNPDVSFTVPPQVKTLFEGAFFRTSKLEEVILPEGLQRIECRAFLETDVKRVTVPSSVSSISEKAFWGCPRLELVDFRCGEDALDGQIFHACPRLEMLIDGQKASFEQELRLKGISLLGQPRYMSVPEGDFWGKRRFVELAQRCAGGNAEAMMEFAEHFESLGADEFFARAANFWRYRAYLYGSPRAKECIDICLMEHPRQQIPSIITEKLYGSAMGNKFRALGFLFFEPDREYSLMGKDENGIVEVCSWCGEEGPDEDGFGREELYDWWYLDEHLNPIPGVKMIHNHSRHERRAFAKRFEQQYETALKAVKGKQRQEKE